MMFVPAMRSMYDAGKIPGSSKAGASTACHTMRTVRTVSTTYQEWQGSDSAGSDAGPKWTHRSCRVSAVSIRHQQRVVRDAHTHCAEPTMSATPAKELERCLLGGPMRSALACCAGRPSKAEPFQGAWCRRMAARDSLWGQQHACGGRNEGAPALSIPGLPLSEPAWLLVHALRLVSRAEPRSKHYLEQ